jgi:DNA (cytosine-5)-methyltransferase 1
MKKIKYIDLFAGAGGLSEGFIREGYEPIAHVEMDLAACYTLKTRTAYHYLKNEGKYDVYVEYLKGKISRSELYSHIPSNLLDSIINLPIGTENNPKIHKAIHQRLGKNNVDLIVGGPPCQAYSLVGRARSANGMSGDKRNFLYVQYAKYLEEYNPKMFVFENVLGLKSAKGGQYLRNMEKLFFTKGYQMQLFTVDAKNFGVLQSRKRIIIIGWRKDLKVNIPNLEEIKSEVLVKVKSILCDLPELNSGEGLDKFVKYKAGSNLYLTQSGIRNGIKILTQHVSRPNNDQDKEIYSIAVDKWNTAKERLNYNDLPEILKTHKNRHSFFDRFKVVAEDLNYSHTIVAHIAKDGHYYIHPDLKQNRSISVREAARLQSFPDDYYFEGVKEGDCTNKTFSNRTASFKQIGNAVPPLMAGLIAKSIIKAL